MIKLALAAAGLYYLNLNSLVDLSSMMLSTDHLLALAVAFAVQPWIVSQLD